MYISYACLIYLLNGNPEYSHGHLESLYLLCCPPPWICNCLQEVYAQVVVFLLYSLHMSMHRGNESLIIWPACVLWGSGKILMIYEQLNFSLCMNLKEVQFQVEVLSSIT
jgi:hypothetical protein